MITVKENKATLTFEVKSKDWKKALEASKQVKEKALLTKEIVKK